MRILNTLTGEIEEHDDVSKATHRLTDLETKEVSLVDEPANGQPFLIVKSKSKRQPPSAKTSSLIGQARAMTTWRAFAAIAESFGVAAETLVAVADEVEGEIVKLTSAERRAAFVFMAQALDGLTPAVSAVQEHRRRRGRLDDPEVQHVLRETITDSLESLIGLLQAIRSAPTTKDSPMKKKPTPAAVWPSDLSEAVTAKLYKSAPVMKADDAHQYNSLMRAVSGDLQAEKRIVSHYLDLQNQDLSAAVAFADQARAVLLRVDDFKSAQSLASKLGLGPLGGRTDGGES